MGIRASTSENVAVWLSQDPTEDPAPVNMCILWQSGGLSPGGRPPLLSPEGRIGFGGSYQKVMPDVAMVTDLLTLQHDRGGFLAMHGHLDRLKGKLTTYRVPKVDANRFYIRHYDHGDGRRGSPLGCWGNGPFTWFCSGHIEVDREAVDGADGWPQVLMYSMWKGGTDFLSNEATVEAPEVIEHYKGVLACALQVPYVVGGDRVAYGARLRDAIAELPFLWFRKDTGWRSGILATPPGRTRSTFMETDGLTCMGGKFHGHPIPPWDARGTDAARAKYAALRKQWRPRKAFEAVVEYHRTEYRRMVKEMGYVRTCV